MSIKRTIITTILALAMVAVAVPGVTQADQLSDLLAQIQALQSQLLSLQGGTGATPVPTGVVACSGVTFTRNLTVGSTGSDVKCLQVLLNTNGYTLAASGAGSPGMETSYFGTRTLAVVKQFQAAKGMVPANQVGPQTRAALNALLGTSGTPVTTLPQGCTSTSGFSPITGQSCGNGVPVIIPTGAGLQVMLAADNPAASSVVIGQATAPLAKFVFVNGDNAQVTVTGLKLHKTGVSADSDLVNVYLFNGATRLTDAASVSSGVVSFNDSTGLLMVPAGGSITVTVMADVTGTAGETVGVSLAASTDITTNASSIRGNFPVTGNSMNLIGSASTLATVNFAGAIATSVLPTLTTVDPQTDFAVWQHNGLSVGTRAVNLTRLALTEIGSINFSDIQNFRLYIDGVQVGSAVAGLDSNGKITFDLTSAPKRLETGTHPIKVLADLIGGSSRTFSFSLKTAADVTFVDTQYGANVLPTVVSSSAFSALRNCYDNSSTYGCTISSGTITVTKATDSPSGNVINTASSQTLAKYIIKANGEKVKIDSLKVDVTCANAQSDVKGLRNGALYANGVQIGSTSTLFCNSASTGGGGTPFYTTFTLGSSLIVTPGTPVTLEVKADIYDYLVGYTASTYGLQSNDTLTARLLTLAGNATGLTSSSTTTVPAGTIAANSLTVKVGSLTLSKYTAYTNQSPVAPVTNYKIGHFTVSNDSVETVNVSTLQVNLNAVASTYATNLYVKFGNDTTTTKPTISAYQNTWSVNYSLAPGTTKDFMVFADLNASTSGTARVGAYVDGTTGSSATDTNSGSTTSTTTGQQIIFTSGYLTPAFASTPQTGNVIGGQQILAGRYQFTAANDSFTVTEMKIKTISGASAAMNDAILKDGSTVLGTRPFDTQISAANDTAYFSGLSIAVPANTTKFVDVYLDLAPASATAGTDYINTQVTLDEVKYMNSQGGIKYMNSSGNSDTVAATNGLAKDANVQIVYHSLPTVTVPASFVGGSVVSGAQASIYQFTIAADPAGPVSWKQLGFPITVNNGSGTGTPALNAFKFFRGSTDITSLVTIDDASGNAVTGAASITKNAGATTFYVTMAGSTEEVIPAGQSYTYTVKATCNAFSVVSTAGRDSVSVSLGSDTGTTNYTGTQRHYILASTTGGDLAELANAYNSGNAITSNFIWSDMAATGADANSGAVGHTATITASSADWLNGYLVQNLPLDVRATSAQ